MNADHPFDYQINRFLDCRRRLIDCEGKPDDAALLDALRGAIDLRGAIVSTVRSALEDECTASRLRGRLDKIEARLRVIERCAERKREMALAAMAEAGLRHLEAPDLRINLREAPPLAIIADESLIPEAYLISAPPCIDYAAIREALKGGAKVPGAALAAAKRYLSVRTS